MFSTKLKDVFSIFLLICFTVGTYSFIPAPTPIRAKPLILSKGLETRDQPVRRAGIFNSEIVRFAENKGPIETNDKADSLLDIVRLIKNPVSLSIIAFLYWYLLVFGAAAASNGLPVPSFIPLVPSWPPTDQELIPVVEDSIHFFYISDALNYIQTGLTGSESLPQLRLAFFNVAEAWIFSFLPLLLADKKRLPLPILLVAWCGGLLLTNAFLAPYLLAREIFGAGSDAESDGMNSTEMRAEDANGNDDFAFNLLKKAFGLIATLVIGYASYETIVTTANTPKEWIDFFDLVQSDRTYLAFAVDLTLFSCFQAYLLQEVQNQKRSSAVKNTSFPLLSLLRWLYT